MKTPQSKINRTIKCPHCGHEYDISEIVVPGEFIGHPDKIIKDALGKILYLDYNKESHEPVSSEKFICEDCNKTFIVYPQISFEVATETEELDFANQSVSLLDD